MEPVVIIDFETTGLSPERGARATEVACVLIRDGQVVDRYQSLMNAGVYVPPFIEELTGISNEMVRSARPVAAVMREALAFVGDRPLIAHNASFDFKFWRSEIAYAGAAATQSFACSMRVARRVFPGAPNHKLGPLCEYAGVTFSGRHHRALADADATASLVLCMEEHLRARYKVPEVTHRLLRRVQETPVARFNAGVPNFVRPGRQELPQPAAPPAIERQTLVLENPLRGSPGPVSSNGVTLQSPPENAPPPRRWWQFWRK